MNGAIVHFTPSSIHRISENCEAFIRLCRDELTVFGGDLDWSRWDWPGAHFTKMGVRSRCAPAEDLLDTAFIDFAKAYFRYQQGMKPTLIKNEMKALRAIEAALLASRDRADVGLIDLSVLDQANQLTRQHYSEMAAYNAGHELERLARFLSEKHLVPTYVGDWKSSNRRPPERRIQTGPEARAMQAKKLPSEEALNALAEIFSLNPLGPCDRFTTATFAMTLCAPVRISEILELPVDCEIEEKDSRGSLRYGWRFYSAKGFEGDIKWVPTVMVPIAKEAMLRIRELTEPSRMLARWLESESHDFFRHPACPAVADDVPLAADQVASALGLKSIAHSGLKGTFGAYTLRDLAQWVRLNQPRRFPWVSERANVRFSRGLFSMTRNLLHARRTTSPVILWAPSANSFNFDLGPRETLDKPNQSIFDRYGYTTSGGRRLKLTSHQSRHLLNTISNRGGMSQDLIAKWSGRADKKQNRVYNHMNEFERVAEAEAIDPDRLLFGPEGMVSVHGPITVKELALVERGAIHVTDYGVCVHDYVISPCERFRDCLNCSEQVCIKGDQAREQRIRSRLAEVEVDLSAARGAVESGYVGSDRWVEHHEKLAGRLRKLVAILDDPSVEDGALIKLTGHDDYSHLNRALRDVLPDALLDDRVQALDHPLSLLGEV